MRKLAAILIAISLFASLAHADLVDRIRNPGQYGLPANEFAELMRFWIRGTYTDQQILSAVNQICHCGGTINEINVTEQGQAQTIKNFITNFPTPLHENAILNALLKRLVEEERIADLRGRMILLQAGAFPIAAFRTYYGLPQQ